MSKTGQIHFKKISLDDKSWLRNKFAEENSNACEAGFANQYLWGDQSQLLVASLFGCALFRYQDEGKETYAYPIGDGDKRAVIQRLLEETAGEDKELRIKPLSRAEKKEIATWFPGVFFTDTCRDEFDYIYKTEDLITLAGRRHHGRRTYISHFKEEGNWAYESITENNQRECEEMLTEWENQRWEKWNSKMEMEESVVRRALREREILQLTGGALRKNGKIVAFSIGEPLNQDTYVIHFEKALPQVEGAYPMINQQFILHECQGYSFINREDDAGDSGLRKAKMSYGPAFLREKYLARTSQVVFAQPEIDRPYLKELWQLCFKDSEDYVDLFLNKRLDDENMLVIYREGRPVSMAAFLPIVYYGREGVYPARYVYAVGTHPEYRGRGLTREILNFAKENWKLPLILTPETEELDRFYEEQGFQMGLEGKRESLIQKGTRQDKAAVLSENSVECYLEDGVKCSMRRATPEEYLRIRDLHLKQPGYVGWEKKAIEFALEDYEREGGEIFLISESGGRQDVLLYMIRESTMVVVETTLQKHRDEILAFLMEREHIREAIMENPKGMIWFPDSWPEDGPSLPGYLNLNLG